jgi:PAS domain S-box-containing protein
MQSGSHANCDERNKAVVSGGFRPDWYNRGLAMQTSDTSATHTDSAEIEALRAIVEGTAQATGEAFFQSLVTNLAKAMDVRYAFVAEFAGPGAPTRARTLAYWFRERLKENIEWDLTGTPCEDVVRGNLCHYPTDVAIKFPADTALAKWGIQSYLGVPLRDADGKHLGHLAVFDERPMPSEPRKLFIFRIFAARAAAELQRLRMEQRVIDSEQRFRDLYEEAPIAYIYERVDSHFVSANRAACKLLGLKPEEVPHIVGVSLLADVPDTQRKIAAALEGMRQGKEYSAVELELRRKDNGRPVWVQWWTRPEPDGLHTRTMLVDITERVLMERAKAQLEQQNQYLQEEIKQAHNFENIVGRSPALGAALENVRRVAPTDASVLITGETGTGKELIARAVHSASNRRDKPLIKVNCAALPTGLVESELFGHERGAFSGAIARRIGRFELAHGGTIFLDEIGEVPPEVQVKLLRVLQEREFERVGGNASIKADVRIIAATNRDLLACVKAGTFREDLYYRLNVFPIKLPPLRERKEDVSLLAQYLVSKYCARLGKRIDRVDERTMQRLLDYPWPGNVRELENIIERAVILAPGNVLEIGPELLAVAPTTDASNRDESSLETLQRKHILAMLEKTNWVIEGATGAAKLLDLHPNTLRSRLKKLGITRAGHEAS